MQKGWDMEVSNKSMAVVWVQLWKGVGWHLEGNSVLLDHFVGPPFQVFKLGPYFSYTKLAFYERLD